MPLKIFKRGEIWHYRGTVAGQRLRGSTGATDKTIALRIAAEREAREWKRGLDGPAAVLTFAQATALYRSARKPERFILPILDYWKNTPVREITAGAIRASCVTLKPHVSAATWNRQVIVPTQAIINHAAEAELCPRICVKRYPVTKREKEPATWEWITTFRAHANPHLGALACFMYLTGARISEALQVRWEDVDLRGERARIRQSKLNNDERWAHLPPELIVAIANIAGERQGKVFLYATRESARVQWNKVVERSGLPHLPFHACRHGFATGLLDKGVNPKTVAKRGGWKSAQHVFETYGHDVADRTVTDVLVDTPKTQRRRKSV
jgi:integrase